MTFADVIGKYPDSVPIFLKHGLSCIGCPFAAQETIEQGAEGHGINIEDLLKDLNDNLKEKKDGMRNRTK
ncbi:MAG: DUF1858 domain-containing protein [Candidatus Woesearchaeota archaeon]|nr:MAG: DUF1858 domain-containing protein [Candidatus Woesearchaeota archaeon]